MACSEELTILCCSFLTLLASDLIGARLSHWLNRKFVRTDDTIQDSEETATAFTVSQSSHKATKSIISSRLLPRMRAGGHYSLFHY